MKDKDFYWNLWHGCIKKSEGCKNCYVYARDEKYELDASAVYRTKSFRLPVQKNRQGEYKIPSGSTIYTCFTSDFFLDEADEWRREAWDIIRERSDVHFFMITKRIERFKVALPEDWGEGLVLGDSAYVPREKKWRPGLWQKDNLLSRLGKRENVIS